MPGPVQNQAAKIKDRPWIFRTYAGHSNATESNKLFLRNLAKGQTGLSVAFDLPTQMGYDPDHELAEGEVGRVGVPVWNLKQMQKLMQGIPADEINCSFTINATAAYILAAYIIYAEQSGAKKHKLSGTVQNDIVKEYLARGTYIFPPRFSKKFTADIIAYCTAEMPKWNPINICSYHLQEAGAQPVDEIAFTLANAIDILDYLRKREKIDDEKFEQMFARISFFVNSGIKFITEICKMKAFKKLWQETALQKYNIKNPSSYRFRYGVQVNSLGLTSEQPENNVYRILLETLGVVLSKDARARAVQLPAWNEAMGLPRPFDQQWSLRMQQIIAYETDLLEFADIFEGSKVIEQKTEQIIEQVKLEMQNIEAIGGVLSAIESGYMKQKLVASHRDKRRAIENGDEKIIGVNCYQKSEISPFDESEKQQIENIDKNAEKKMCQEIKAFRNQRDDKKVQNAIEKLEEAIKTDRNIMPATINAVKAGVTIGEWAEILRKWCGEYRAPTGLSASIEPDRSQKAQMIIDKVEKLEKYTGRKLKMLIAKPGLDGHSNGAEQLALRARDCGFEVIYEGIRLSPRHIAMSALEEGVHVVGISLLSGSHIALSKSVIENMKKLQIGDIPVVVGGIVPKKDHGEMMKFGVAQIFTPSDYNIYDIIEKIIEIIGEKICIKQ